MTHNTFGVGTVPPPYPPQIPGYPPLPPSPPTGGGRRRWPILLAAATVGAAVAAGAAAVITTQVRDATASAPNLPAQVTVSVPAPTPAAPAPLPTEQADRQTCQQGWVPAGQAIDSATSSLNVLPKGMKVVDPAVQANPEWANAVSKAGEFYRQASSTLDGQIAPGTTPVLAEAAHTAVTALHALGDAMSPPSDINGNVGEIANAAAAQVGVLCQRLAP